MIIRTVKDKDNPYVQVNRSICDDERISYKAMGIHLYLMSKPHEWEAQEADIIKRHTEGATAVRSGIAELIEHGYMNRIRVVNDNGQIVRWRLDVYETPDLNPHYTPGRTTEHITEPLLENPNVDSPVSENPNLENRNHSKEREVVKKEVSKEREYEPSRAHAREELQDESCDTEPHVKALVAKLHSVGVMTNPYITDKYMDLHEVDNIPFEYILRGITAAADNGKQHHFSYVSACIRNQAKGVTPDQLKKNTEQDETHRAIVAGRRGAAAADIDWKEVNQLYSPFGAIDSCGGKNAIPQ